MSKRMAQQNSPNAPMIIIVRMVMVFVFGLLRTQQ